MAHLPDSTLNIAKGIEQPATVNPNLANLRPNRRQLTVEDYYRGIIEGDRVVFAQAITLIESTRPADQQMARELLSTCMPHTGNAIRVGITGVPGVGKSTFIEALGTWLTDECNRRLAVLAVDPTSQRSRGSILGDKTRMAELSVRKNAFIRPSPTTGTLGGVAQTTRETILLCEAAGFDTIFIETVGVGQSETAVHGMVDFFLLLMLAGAGDEIQGIKRGIMEMADGIVITKADGDNVLKAQLARQEYQNALHLFTPSSNQWRPQVLTCSSKDIEGIYEVWQMIQDFEQTLKTNGCWDLKRKKQLTHWMEEAIQQHLQHDFLTHPVVSARFDATRETVLSGQQSPFDAARELLDCYHDSRGRET